MKNFEICLYLIKDKHGNQCTVVVNDPSDNAIVCGLLNENGDEVYAELRGAYRIHTLCEENGLECKYIEQELDFDSIWDSGKIK